MNLYDIVTGQQVLDAAIAATKWTKPKEATFDKWQKEVVKQVKDLTVAHFVAEIEPVVRAAYDEHVATIGERDMAEMLGSNVDEWDSGLDDRLETICEPYQATLSADYLAKATIDNGIRNADGVAVWCKEFGVEMYKGLTQGRTPAQILAAVSILPETLQQWHAYAAATYNTPEKAEQTAESEQSELDRIVTKIKGHIGDDYDETDITDALDMVLDDDDILAYGAAARLGIEVSEADELRTQALGGGIDKQSLLELVKASDLPIPAARRSRNAPKNAPGSEGPKGEEIPTEVFQALKQHSAIKATEFAAELGVSRSSYLNYENGKTKLTPTTEQRQLIRDRLLADLSGLLGALEHLEPNEPRYGEITNHLDALM